MFMFVNLYLFIIFIFFKIFLIGLKMNIIIQFVMQTLNEQSACANHRQLAAAGVYGEVCGKRLS